MSFYYIISVIIHQNLISYEICITHILQQVKSLRKQQTHKVCKEIDSESSHASFLEPIYFHTFILYRSAQYTIILFHWINQLVIILKKKNFDMNHWIKALIVRFILFPQSFVQINLTSNFLSFFTLSPQKTLFSILKSYLHLIKNLNHPSKCFRKIKRKIRNIPQICQLAFLDSVEYVFSVQSIHNMQ